MRRFSSQNSLIGMSVCECLPLSASHESICSFWSCFQENLSPAGQNPCAVGSYLGMVDPWYECNIKSLGSMIPKLAKMVRFRIPNTYLSSDLGISFIMKWNMQQWLCLYSATVTMHATYWKPSHLISLLEESLEVLRNRQKDRKLQKSLCCCMLTDIDLCFHWNHHCDRI